MRLLPCILLFAGAIPAFGGSPFTSAQLLAAVRGDLASHFRLEGDFQVELAHPWTPPARSASSWQVVVTEYPAMPMATLYVHCQVLADGDTVDDTTLALRAALWRDAWFSRQPLAAGGVFDPSVLEARRVDILRERDALPAAVGDRSFIFVRQVPADRMLTWQDLARRPMVRKGELVDAVASEGGLLVTLKAQALENGVLGDLITVRNVESRKDIAALVVAEDRVAVRF